MQIIHMKGQDFFSINNNNSNSNNNIYIYIYIYIYIFFSQVLASVMILGRNSFLKFVKIFNYIYIYFQASVSCGSRDFLVYNECASAPKIYPIRRVIQWKQA